MHRHNRAGLVLVGLWLGLTAPLARATVFVANNGQDTNDCLSAATACRSITRGIAAATAGEVVSVGPGIYGDIDGDGLFTIGTGDEIPTLAHPDCVVDVDKASLRIRSIGALTTPTVITGGGADMHLVCLNEDFLELRGFTLTRNGPSKPAVLAAAGSIHGRVQRNLALGTGAGFSIEGHDYAVFDNRALATAGTGFILSGTGPHGVVRRNVSMDNAGHGFHVGAYPTVRLRGNVAGGNALVGFFVDTGAAGVYFEQNHMLGNRQHGLQVEPGTSFSQLRRNNLYGNGTEIGLPLPNCGLFNNSGAALIASNNYWGAASGPGSDPADAVCNGIGSTTATAPLFPPSSMGLASFR